MIEPDVHSWPFVAVTLPLSLAAIYASRFIWIGLIDPERFVSELSSYPEPRPRVYVYTWRLRFSGAAKLLVVYAGLFVLGYNFGDAVLMFVPEYWGKDTVQYQDISIVRTILLVTVAFFFVSLVGDQVVAQAVRRVFGLRLRPDGMAYGSFRPSRSFVDGWRRGRREISGYVAPETSYEADLGEFRRGYVAAWSREAEDDARRGVLTERLTENSVYREAWRREALTLVERLREGLAALNASPAS